MLSINEVLSNFDNNFHHCDTAQYISLTTVVVVDVKASVCVEVKVNSGVLKCINVNCGLFIL